MMFIPVLTSSLKNVPFGRDIQIIHTLSCKIYFIKYSDRRVSFNVSK